MKAIVLAAGKGKRLQSEKFSLPKVLRTVCSKPLISHVLNNISFIPQEDTYIVVGYKREEVINTVKGKYNYQVQEEQLGTGHAVMATQPCFKEYKGDVIVLYGDMPLFEEATYRAITEYHTQSGAACTLLTAEVDNPPDYGRIIRDSTGKITDIIEKKDCTPEQLKINELNLGIYVFDAQVLFDSLKHLNNDNNQKEYYLTDVPKIIIKNGLKVESYTISDITQVYGVNTLEDLELCEKILTERNK